MPEIELNCQNLPCPQPVLRCKACIDAEAPDILAVLVDNDAARQNVKRFMESRGYAVTASETAPGQWRLEGTRDATQSSSGPAGADAVAPEAIYCEAQQKVTVLLTADTIGSGDDVLGAKLMQNFLATLPELGSELWRVVCLNGAVRLATKEHPALAALQRLEQAGASVLVCGTCLDHFGLLEEKAVGQTTNMLDVVTSLQLATKVIRP